LEECLYQLRNTNCKNCIDPYEWFKNFVNDAQSSDWRLKIITNGNPQQQMNKLKSLNLSFVANIVEVIFANEYKPKPMIDSYLKLRNVEKFIEPIYVGDSLLDQEFAHNCKIEFFDVNLIK
jgi:phosphoglycolate phosphatase-like HAD superfamily hydrolase